jgi:hypothetical protein
MDWAELKEDLFWWLLGSFLIRQFCNVVGFLAATWDYFQDDPRRRFREGREE